MVRIRLRRMGAKRKPFYRIVVANQQAARNGGFIENIGTYDPMTNPETVTLEHERAAHLAWRRRPAKRSCCPSVAQPKSAQ